ncbi:MAG: hypothetical protein WDW38_004048 [Sanguina aurantia]
MASYYQVGGDVEDGWNGPSKRTLDPSYEFAEQQVRLGFVRKVFGLLTCQLAVTVGVTAAFMFNPPVKDYVLSNPWALWTPVVLSLLLVLFMAFSESARRTHPWNLLLLGAFTLCESIMIATISATIDTHTVMLAAGITAAVVLSLTLFTFQTKIDFTVGSGMLFSLFMVLLGASIGQMFLHLPGLQLAISAGGAMLFSMYLVFDIQMLMGGNKYAISPDEHVFAALNLYLDILNIFLYILQILNQMNRQ